MSDILYKKEQQDVLNLSGKNQIVSASAGSGKTTVMIQKIVNMILNDKKSIKEILVLTYTKTAAEEMKQKLVTEMKKYSKTNPNILSQIDDVQTADISTIHSFFQKTIKKYFMALDINPSFVLLDENQQIKYETQALDEVIEKFTVENPTQMAELIERYGGSRNDDKIKKIIKELNSFLLALANSDEWCKNISTMLYVDTSENKAISIINNYLVRKTQHFITALKNLQNYAEKLEEKSYIGYINTYLSQLELVKNDDNRFFDNYKIWQKLNKPARVCKSKCFEDLTYNFDLIKKDIEKFCEKMKNQNFADEVAVKKNLQDTKIFVDCFCGLAKEYQLKYKEIKRQNNVFDFADLEIYMLKLLEDDGICEEIKNKYCCIFIDEYQDANRVQEKILKKISKPNNRFLVGDVKQSIYAFRLAEPDIFLEIQKEYEKDAQSEVQFLNCNFRSRKQILDFINIVFEKIMTEKTSKIDYKNTSMLKGEADYVDIEEQNIKPVEITIIQKEVKQEKNIPNKVYSVKNAIQNQEELKDAQLEAFYIAQKISELLGKKIWIAKEECEREITYADITILLRSRGDYLDTFCGTLSSFGIPLYANTNESLFDDSDVILLLNLLKMMINPHDDISLVSLMHSVIGNFSYRELAYIRQNADGKYFYECVENYSKDDAIKSKIDMFFSELKEFNFDATYLGVHNALNKIISKFDFSIYILQKDDGLEKIEKINKFVNDFLTNGYDKDILGFLDFVEQNKDNISGPNYQAGEDCVNITTIHSSKGLEYPIVILANANQDYTKKQDDSSYKLNQKLGMGLKAFDAENRCFVDNVAYSAIKITNQNNNFAELVRLLYVALTRAQNHLIIVGTSNKLFNAIDDDFDVMSKKSYLELIISSLPKKIIEKINYGENIDEKDYSVNIIKGKYEQNMFESNGFVGGTINDNNLATLQEYFDYTYKYQTNIAIKNSVSGIMKQEEYISQNYAPQNLVVAEHLSETATDIGVAYHAVMEQIDFEEVTNLADVNEFLKNSTINAVENVDAEKVFKAIMLIKSLGMGEKYFKEQQFMMYLPHNEIVENGDKTKVLVQGVVDLCILGKKNILVDYKFTKIRNKETIIKKYKTQLKLYKKATEYALNRKIDEVYLLLLNSGELVKII